jgi:periplasmic divalent cation tolerance protein
MSLKYPDEAKGAEFYKIGALFFMSALLVLTNLPDRAAAERLGDLLIEKQLAACVNILAPCRSVYRWQGAVQHDEEHPMLIKTTAERYQALEQAIRGNHPYELPEIIAVPVERGLPEYLQWVAAETRAETKA